MTLTVADEISFAESSQSESYGKQNSRCLEKYCVANSCCLNFPGIIFFRSCIQFGFIEIQTYDPVQLLQSLSEDEQRCRSVPLSEKVTILLVRNTVTSTLVERLTSTKFKAS